MNYCIRRNGALTARVAFELTRPLHPTDPVEIWRIRAHEGSFVSHPEGVILRSSNPQARAVVVNAQVGDVIVVRHRHTGAGTAVIQAYRIGNTFVPRHMEDTTHLFHNVSITPPTNRIETDEGRVIHWEEHELKILFSGKHPRWLQDVIDGQLRGWREQAPTAYIRLAPREWLDRDVFLVAIHDPYRALTEYKDRLTQSQLAFCIRRLPAAAVRFAFDRIPAKLRPKYLKEHSSYILDNHLQELSNSELRTYSWGDPIKAFKCRHSVLPRRSAIMLSSTYTVAWIRNHNTSKVDLRREIFASLLEFPDEWLKSNPKGIESIFRRLRGLLGIRFEEAELRLMLDAMTPKGRGALARYIAQHI